MHGDEQLKLNRYQEPPARERAGETRGEIDSLSRLSPSVSTSGIFLLVPPIYHSPAPERLRRGSLGTI